MHSEMETARRGIAAVKHTASKTLVYRKIATLLIDELLQFQSGDEGVKAKGP